MPVYEWICDFSDCPESGERIEAYTKTVTPPAPFCATCGHQMRMCVSTFNAIWTKPLGRYNGGTQDGHTVLRKNSCRIPGQAIEREYIDTVQKQREYCREEGLVPPDQMPSSVSVNTEGTKLQDGMPGTWAGTPAALMPK